MKDKPEEHAECDEDDAEGEEPREPSRRELVDADVEGRREAIQTMAIQTQHMSEAVNAAVAAAAAASAAAQAFSSGSHGAEAAISAVRECQEVGQHRETQWEAAARHQAVPAQDPSSEDFALEHIDEVSREFTKSVEKFWKSENAQLKTGQDISTY